MADTVIQEVHKTITAVLERDSLDARTCYTSLYAEPPEGKRFVFECSEVAVIAAVRQDLSERTDGAVADIRFVLLPEEGVPLPALFTVANSVADVRKSPSHVSELITQVICGDALTPLTTEGDWFLVRLEDGYVGWIRSWHLKATTQPEFDAFRLKARHRISGNVINIYEQAHTGASRVGDAVIGTVLLASPCGKRGWRQVQLCDGRTGYVEAKHVEPIPRARRISRSRLATTGKQFMGIPYLWGGTTPKGFDCSGLVQRIFRLHGLMIPRDSDLQARFGRRKPVGRSADLETGDLLFFGKTERQITHVAMYLSDGLFLHAHGQVRIAALDPQDPLYDGVLADSWRGTRDPFAD